MAASKQVKDLIKKFAIKNAIDYGKAEVGSVLGKVIPSAKGIPIPELKKEVQEIVSQVNKMKKAELEKEFVPFEKEFEKKAKETAEKNAKPKIVIEGAEQGHVITRFPPEPGGYIQIGNVKQCLLSEEIARIYDGKLYLYFDDTNPEKCKQEYVEGIKRDTAWLGIKFAKEYYASDSIEKIYEAGIKLLKQGDAYVCLCDGEEVSKNRGKKKECKHRKQKPSENVALFNDMLNKKYEEGQIIVRLKGDMKSENATFRDPTLFRIKNMRHYRQGEKYVVWPTYHINTPVIDNIYGVTDVLRGKEYEIWDHINKKMLSSLGLKPPRFHYESRLRFKEIATAKREIRNLLKEGFVKSWDDPRLGTIMALRRRGIQPDAIREFVLRFGLSLTDAMMSIDMLLAENKKLIDPIAKHMFFVNDPIKVTVGNAKPIMTKLRLHPSNETGHREYETNDIFYVSGDDADALQKGNVVRLKDLMDIKILDTGKEVTAVQSHGTQNDKIIQWVSDKNFVKCSVLVPGRILDDKGNYNKDSLKTVKGYVESYAEKLNEHEIVQFERFGYCILDDKKKMSFIFISK